MLPFFVWLVCPLLSGAQDESESLELKTGDRVVMVGAGFVEREGEYGHLEAAMTAQWADRKVTFRNLGWSGDTVEGRARSYFGPPVEGFERLRNHLEWLKPTVVLACYGSVESFDGEAGLEKFEGRYEHLIAMMKEAAPKARVVLVSPPPFESKGAPLPDMADRNEMLGLYRDRIREIAVEAEVLFADLFEGIGSAEGMTSDGVNYSPAGYAVISERFIRVFGWEPEVLPTDQLEALREAIVEKNRLFFYRWRPQNETYLYGFRKQEQGENAKEVPEFDPLIEAEEEKIVALREGLGK